MIWITLSRRVVQQWPKIAKWNWGLWWWMSHKQNTKKNPASQKMAR